MITFTELEKLGIVGIYKDQNQLYVITKYGDVYEFDPLVKAFFHFSKLY